MKAIAALVLLACACRTYDTVYTSDAGSLCVAPQQTCDDVCVDPTSDRGNCGDCGHACGPTELCTASVCSPCGAGETACGASGAPFCANLSANDENCGACDKACPHGTSCSGGQCVCPLTTCGAECIDTENDVSHCGSCDDVCPPPAPNEIALCSKGQCGVTCTPSFADCDGTGANGCETNLGSSASDCGVCGRACIAGACSSGMCPMTTYATGSTLGPLAVDATDVIWGDRSANGAIFSAPTAGGTTTSVYADASTTVLGVDAGNLVWLHLNNQIESLPLGGGSATVVATASGILAVAFGGGYVYYATSSGGLLRAPEDGSAAPVTITTATAPLALAVDGTTVYAVTFAGDVVSAPIGAQNVTATTFAPSVSATTLTLDATHVYWTTSSGDVVRQTKTGGTVVTLATSQSIATNLTTDGVSLYWGTLAGEIERLATSGGATMTLATNQLGGLRTVAVDATRVYWATGQIVASTTK